MLITRDIGKLLKKAKNKIGIIAITGPRQSGKTTLVQNMFKNYTYINLEDLTIKDRISQDPRNFIYTSKNIILDEVQKYPELLSYMQVAIDENFAPARYIITGSENLLLSHKISQSLAGRVIIFSLLPFSVNELKRAKLLNSSHIHQMRLGWYPRIYSQKLKPNFFYPDYVVTYIERDIRNIKNIGNIDAFERFLKLLAGRSGQVLNLSSLASDTGITYKTAKEWLSILEATYIVFKLQPYYKNFNKRIIKSPKIYFYDTGLLCYLLGIDTDKELLTHSFVGNIFENMIVADIKKQMFNKRSTSEIFFWRDSNNNEIDLLIKNGTNLYPIEIKLGASFNSDYLKNLKLWHSLQKHPPDPTTHNGYIIYTGQQDKVNGIKFINWQNIDLLSRLL